MQISLADIDAEILRRKRNLFASMFPETGALSRHGYGKHMEFFRLGREKRVRLFRAANRAGKTNAGSYEIVCHLTGKYPDWWEGKRFHRATSWDVAGETGKLTRDGVQFKLFGSPDAIGTGMVPADLIGERRAKSGISDAYDTVRVKHVSGDWSVVNLKSFDQGREAFQSTERDGIWLDEEPPLAIYTEAMTRTMTTGGIVMMTFTPLKGMSETVQFLEQQAKDDLCALVTATWDDAPHLTKKDKDELLASYPPHQRDARSKGIPSLGSGAIYPIAETDVLITPFEIPKHWRHVYAMDVGWNNTAAVFLAIDPDSEIIYVVSDYKRGSAEPSIHAEAVRTRARGDGKPGTVDPAARGRSQKDGEKLLEIYRDLGLSLVEADKAVESGIYEVWQKFSIGRLKVFSTCKALMEEYRVYRRDEKGRIVKTNDHIMDALRYAIVSGVPIATQETVAKSTNISMPRGVMSL
jgi:phage terminase large subunit-like protein